TGSSLDSERLRREPAHGRSYGVKDTQTPAPTWATALASEQMKASRGGTPKQVGPALPDRSQRPRARKAEPTLEGTTASACLGRFVDDAAFEVARGAGVE